MAGEDCKNHGELIPVPVGVSHLGARGVGTTIGAVDDVKGACGPLGGPDQVFAFTLAGSAYDVTITLEPSGFDSALYLRGGGTQPCDQQAGEVACVDVPGVGASDVLARMGLSAGRYYVVIDSGGTSAAGGAYRLLLDAVAR